MAAVTLSALKHHEHAHDDSIWSVKFLNNDMLATGSIDETIKLWSITSSSSNELELLHSFPGHSMGVNSLAYRESRNLVAGTCLDSSIRVWNVQEKSSLKVGEFAPLEVWSLDWHPTEPLLLSGGNTGNAILWNVETGQRDAASVCQKFILCSKFHPDCSSFVVATMEGTIYFVDAATLKVSRKIEAHKSPVRSIEFSNDGRVVLAASDDGTVSIHETSSSANLVGKLQGHSSWVLDISKSPTSEICASASADKSVRVWDLGKRTCIQSIMQTHTDQVWGVDFNPQGSVLASVSDDSSLLLLKCSGSGQD